jgi:hypothetical protein
VAEGDVGEHPPRVLDRLRIVRADLRAGLLEAADQRDRRGVAHVVGLRLEREAEEGDRLAADVADRLLHFDDHPFFDVVVHAEDRFDDLEVVAVALGDVGDGGGVLREAGAAEAGAGLEELRTDARVEADAAGDVLHVGAELLTEDGDLVDERDLRGQEAVRRVLDQLGRLDVRDDEGDLQRVERRVDLLHQLDRFVVGGADDHAVRLHEVFDRGAFAEGLLDDLFDHAAGADRNGRLGDDQLRAVHVLGDRAGDLFDVAEVGGAIGLGRGADGDEDRTGGGDGAGEVGREAEAAFAGVLADDLVEAGLVDGDLAAVEGVDLGDVDVDADHVVAEVGEAGAGDEADVARSDDCDLHLGVPPEKVSPGVRVRRTRGRILADARGAQAGA